MDRIFLIVLAALISGCATQKQMPVDVSLVPNDCANRHAIIKWLESQAQLSKPVFESEHAYEQTRSAIKARIWTIRYSCQPVLSGPGATAHELPRP